MLPKSVIQSDLSGYLLQGGLLFEDSDSELRHQFQSHCGVTCNKIQFQYLQKWEPPTEHVFCFAVLAAHQGGAPKKIKCQNLNICIPVNLLLA